MRLGAQTPKIIKDGFSKEVDELRAVSHNNKNWLKIFEEDERSKTEISSLKVGFNSVFGYYIEVRKTNQDKVPDRYIRKQTLANSERYITEELKEKEDIILHSENGVMVSTHPRGTVNPHLLTKVFPIIFSLRRGTYSSTLSVLL